MAKDLLSGVAKRGTKAEPKKAETDRWTLTLDDKPKLRDEVDELIRLATVEDEVGPLVKQRKANVTRQLFDIWSEKLWDTKKVPDNPQIKLKKIVEKKPTQMDDMSLIFQVNFNAKGLDNLVPKDLPEDKTAQDVLQELLTGPGVGLSEKNALALLKEVDGEIEVTTITDFVGSFNDMYTSSDANIKSAATKLLTYLQAEQSDKPVKMTAFTADEAAAVIKTVQIVRVKEGFFERVCKYVENLEQLRKLVLFIKPTLKISSVEFAISDKKSEKIERLSDTVVDFLEVEIED